MLYTGEDPKLVQARLRKQYGQSNNAYRDAINQYNKEAAEHGASGIDIEDSAGPYQLRSVQDSYMKGQLDKGTRDYLLYDAFGKFARNTGKDIANIAAAYTGGTINNDREESLWADRNKAMAEQGINAEVNQARSKDSYDQDYKAKALQNRVTELQKFGAETFADHQEKWAGMAAKAERSGDKDLAAGYRAIADLNALITSQSTGEMGTEEYAALAALEMLESDPKSAAGILNDVRQMVGSGMRTTEALLNVLATTSTAVGNAATGLLNTADSFLKGKLNGGADDLTDPNTGYVYERTITGKRSDKIDLRATVENLKDTGVIPPNSDIYQMDVNDIYKYAKKLGYIGEKDVNLIRWIKERFSDGYTANMAGIQPEIR